MRKVIAVLAALAGLMFIGAPSFATAQVGPTVAICHAEGNGRFSNPQANDNSAHTNVAKHPDDIWIEYAAGSTTVVDSHNKDTIYSGVHGYDIVSTGCDIDAAKRAVAYVEPDPCLGLTETQCEALQHPTPTTTPTTAPSMPTDSPTATPTCSTWNGHTCEPDNPGPTTSATPSETATPSPSTTDAAKSSETATAAPVASDSPTLEPTVNPIATPSSKLAETGLTTPLGLLWLAASLLALGLILSALTRRHKREH